MNYVPDLERIAQKLAEAEPIEFAILPFRAFTLIGLLQLALRHPLMKMENRAAHEIGVSVAQNLAERLMQIDPAIKKAIEEGWDASLDLSDTEYKQFVKTGDRPQRNYSQLREDIQVEIYLNGIAFGMACSMIASLTEEATPDQWAQLFTEKANEAITDIPIERIKTHIAQLDYMRDYGEAPPTLG
ncbi:MAG TPA: hypothetical protein V6C65_04220 [Allocoleopsis sp.]